MYRNGSKRSRQHGKPWKKPGTFQAQTPALTPPRLFIIIEHMAWALLLLILGPLWLLDVLITQPLHEARDVVLRSDPLVPFIAMLTGLLLRGSVKLNRRAILVGMAGLLGGVEAVYAASAVVDSIHSGYGNLGAPIILMTAFVDTWSDVAGWAIALLLPALVGYIIAGRLRS
jgi:hypothetical protein